MIFINSRELKHDINVHIDKLYQCQSCNQTLVNEKDFNRHITQVHGVTFSRSNSITSNNNNEEGIEFALLKQITKEKKARIRRVAI